MEQNLRDGKLLSNRVYLHHNKGVCPGLKMMYATHNTLLDEIKVNKV